MPAWQLSGIAGAWDSGGRVPTAEDWRPARTLSCIGKWAVITSIGLGNVRVY